MSPRAKSYLLLLIVSAIWGVAGPVIKYVEGYISPLTFLLYRFGVSAAIGIVALKFLPLNWPKSPTQKLLILIYCFLTTTVSLGLLFLGYANTSSITASVINAIYPVMVALAGVAFLHEHVTRRERVGILITIIGTSLIIFQDGIASIQGNLLIVASLVVGVLLAIMAKLLMRHNLHPDSLTHLSFIIGFITLLPLVFFFHPPLPHIPLSVHLGVLYMSVLSGTIAYSLWHKAQKTIEVGETAMFSYTYPLFAAPLSFFWLHESITILFLIGCGIIALGVFIAQTKHR